LVLLLSTEIFRVIVACHRTHFVMFDTTTDRPIKLPRDGGGFIFQGSLKEREIREQTPAEIFWCLKESAVLHLMVEVLLLPKDLQSLF
jgi:hypothetical protein